MIRIKFCFLLLTLALAACATPRALGERERLLHQRALLGAGGPGEPALAVAELTAVDGMPPRLEAVRLSHTGARTLLGAATAEEAQAVERAVRGGAELSAALPPGLLASAAAYDAPAAPAAPAPAAGPESWILPAPLEGFVLSAEPARDRYGDALLLLLRDGRGSTAVIVHRLASPANTAISIRLVAPLLAAAEVRRQGEEGLAVRDVVPLDLGSAAGELHELHALQAHERRAWDEALLELDRAERLSPHSPSIPYNRACVLARAGRSNEALGPLARAVALSPLAFRMHARIDPDLKPLRGTPGFEALVAPRPLQGANRAGGN